MVAGGDTLGPGGTGAGTDPPEMVGKLGAVGGVSGTVVVGVGWCGEPLWGGWWGVDVWWADVARGAPEHAAAASARTASTGTMRAFRPRRAGTLGRLS